ncbi:unnamed protein product [Peniophora sp. CBMAI 1063]|nr:unnamed protein product [Peniophora sp. CBMAI 1063]
MHFRPCDLPNPILLTAPENLEYMRKKEEQAAAKEAKKAGRATGKKRKSEEGTKDDDEPAQKKAKSTSQSSKSSSKSKSASSSNPSSARSATADEIFSIELDGEEDETVEMYDTCDEIRKKIDIHLTITGQTKAAFLRDIARAGWPDDPPRIQSKQLSDFQTKEGATSGSTSRVYYGAYCYFEKKRIAEGKDKSVHRLCMEDEWPTGMVREREKAYIIGVGREIYTSELGKPVVY